MVQAKRRISVLKAPCPSLTPQVGVQIFSSPICWFVLPEPLTIGLKNLPKRFKVISELYGTKTGWKSDFPNGDLMVFLLDFQWISLLKSAGVGVTPLPTTKISIFTNWARFWAFQHQSWVPSKYELQTPSILRDTVIFEIQWFGSIEKKSTFFFNRCQHWARSL